MWSGLVERVTIRTALVVGFGLTLGLWLFAGYQVTLRVRDAHRTTAAISARYQHAQELLTSVRTDVLEASVLVRDALLDPEAGPTESYRRTIDLAYDQIDHALASYVPVTDTSAERGHVNRMRSEVRELRNASRDVLAADTRLWPLDARVRLRHFMPRRETLLRISDEAQAFNRSAFVDAQRTVTEMEASVQREVWTVFGMAVVISLAIAWFASRHATRLEQRLLAHHVREERITADLQRLSARLVQAQEEEQRRIARELHDEVGQALSAVSVELAVARRRLTRLGADPALLADAQSSADSALRSVRDLSHLLHPAVLDDLGLVAALESHVAEFRRRHRIAVAFTYEEVDTRQPVDTERAVYRIVQEALTNIARHAHATEAHVDLQVGAGVLRIAIDDNGVGFNAIDVERPGRRRGLGLLSIRERAAQLGGSVRIERAASGGARLHVELPVVRDREAGSLERMPGILVDDALFDTAPEVHHV